MNSKNFNFNEIDVLAFAKEGAQLQGVWLLETLQRLVESQVNEAALAARDVRWSVQGEMRTLPGLESQCWLHVSAQTQAALSCQRCLTAVNLDLSVQRSFMFVQGEAQAAELDAQMDDDVLVLTKSLNIQTLIEDELLLALPVVPRHEVCPEHVNLSFQDELEAQEVPHPFAGLAALKRGGLLN